MLIACCSIGNFIINQILIGDISQKGHETYQTEQNVITYSLSCGKEIEIYFFDESVRINESYCLSRSERLEVLCFIVYCCEQKGIACSRTIQSLEAEWIMHNLLYRINYKTESTKDVDLEYIRDKRWYVNATTIMMQILGL